MAKQYSSGYQIDDLQDAVDALVKHLKSGLHVDVNWNGTFIKVTNIPHPVPEVRYEVMMPVHVKGIHPAPTVAPNLANSLRRCLLIAVTGFAVGVGGKVCGA
jgi:hypothetical protein